MNTITTDEILRSIWRQPRATFEKILEDSTSINVIRASIPFVAIAGAGFTLSRASSRSVGETIESLPLLITYVSFVGVISGFIGLYFWSWVLGHSNKWFKGSGEFTDIAKVLSWAAYPFAVTACFWVPKTILFGMDNFTYETPKISNSTFLTVSYYTLLAIEILLFIYACVIWIKGLSVACDFSSWRALAVWVLSYLMVLVPLVVLTYFIF